MFPRVPSAVTNPSASAKIFSAATPIVLLEVISVVADAKVTLIRLP
jgi:hypothetical protein